MYGSAGQAVEQWVTTLDRLALQLESFKRDIESTFGRIEPTSKLTDPHLLSSLVLYALVDSLSDRDRTRLKWSFYERYAPALTTRKA